MEMNSISVSDLNRYYYHKARSSFKARFDLLLYEYITHSIVGEITIEQLNNFEIQEHLETLNEYIHVYWQQEGNKTYLINGKTIDSIYQEMKEWRISHKATSDTLLKYYIENIFPRVFPKDEFFQMIENACECEYCHITLNQINKLIDQKALFKKHITRGWSLEIDRKAANLEYTKDNCVTCCYWCNNAKTDEFSHREFKKIGIEIQKIWNERLKSK
jgi:5-methylcytosine-specific restriction endonuclease McrA